MNDRELLELAAKAAGIEGRYASLDDYPDWMTAHDGEGIYCASNQAWNPITSDAEALRLAVKLDIELYQADDDGPCVFAGYWGKPERRDVTRIFAIEQLGSDPYAATRRAIVRAAAAIGKEMK